jgi:hypothetical protein
MAREEARSRPSEPTLRCGRSVVVVSILVVRTTATEVGAAKVGGPHGAQLAVLDAVHRASPERCVHVSRSKDPSFEYQTGRTASECLRTQRRQRRPRSTKQVLCTAATSRPPATEASPEPCRLVRDCSQSRSDLQGYRQVGVDRLRSRSRPTKADGCPRSRRVAGNQADPMVGSRVQQTCTACTEQAVEVVRNGMDGTGLGLGMPGPKVLREVVIVASSLASSEEGPAAMSYLPRQVPRSVGGDGAPGVDVRSRCRRRGNL